MARTAMLRPLSVLVCYVFCSMLTAEAARNVPSRMLMPKSSWSTVLADDELTSQYPYLVKIQQQLSPTSVSTCSGALIDASTVLTAAHCVANATNGTWVSAQYTITVSAGTPNSQEYPASWSIRHPQYDDNPNWMYVNNDVALIYLDACVDLKEYARLPCNGAQADTCALPGDVWSYGWGRTASSESSNKRVRRSGPYSTRCSCATPEQIPADVEEEYFCIHELEEVEGKPEEICQGDSGGPTLLEQAGSAPLVLGVNSWGDGETCGTIRRKNAGYIADLTRPGINSWVCPFVQEAWSKFVREGCSERTSRDLPWLHRTSRPPLPGALTGTPVTGTTDASGASDIAAGAADQPNQMTGAPVRLEELPGQGAATSQQDAPVKPSSQLPQAALITPTIKPIVPPPQTILPATGTPARVENAAASSTPMLFEVAFLAAAALAVAA